jgi:redox-sensitive bicupin YhaK (pirin superfamily)
VIPLVDVKPDRSFLDRMLRDHAKGLERVVDAYSRDVDRHMPIHPEFAARVFDGIAADDAIFTVDTGMCNVWAARYITPNGRRRVIGSFLHGTMANALPHAIGAQLVYPGRQVISISGDGGLGMLLGELLTGPHFHRGLETVTYVLDGAVSHDDNRGGSGTLDPGDAQWMTAGRGIIHSEEPAGAGPAHMLQLWVNLPAAEKFVEPEYQDLPATKMPVRREQGAVARVYSGSSGGVVAPTRNHVPVTMVELQLDPGASIAQDLPASYNCFLYVLDGEGHFGEQATAASAGQVLWLDRRAVGGRSSLAVHADTPLVALLFAGEPLREPVVARGPFVMNTEEQIAEAYTDLRAGRFAQ